MAPLAVWLYDGLEAVLPVHPVKVFSHRRTTTNAIIRVANCEPNLIGDRGGDFFFLRRDRSLSAWHRPRSGWRNAEQDFAQRGLVRAAVFFGPCDGVGILGSGQRRSANLSRLTTIR